MTIGIVVVSSQCQGVLGGSGGIGGRLTLTPSGFRDLGLSVRHNVYHFSVSRSKPNHHSPSGRGRCVLERVSRGEFLPADERGGEAEESAVEARFAFVADGQAPVAGEPGDGALDLPAVASQPFAGVDAAAGDARDDAALAQPAAVGVEVVPLVRAELDGRRRRGPRRDRMAGTPMTRGRKARQSLVFAALMATARGSPAASEITWIFEPALPRSTGFGPVSEPPFSPGRWPHR